MSIKLEFEKAKADALAIVNKAIAESRSMSAEENAEREKLFARMGEIKAVIASEKELNSLSLDYDEEAANEAAKKAVIEQFSKENKTMDNDKKVSGIELEIEGLKSFARTGRLDSKEFTLSSGTNTAAATVSALMPIGVTEHYQIRQPANGFRRGYQVLGVPTFNTYEALENMKIPLLDDSANTANNDQEGATSGVNADASTGKAALDMVEYHSKAQWYSKKIVQSNRFDVTQRALPMALSRVERKEESDWATTVIADTSAIGKYTASTTAIVLNDLIEWNGSLGAAYDGLPAFFGVSRALQIAIQKLAYATANQAYYSVQNGVEYLFGKPIVCISNLEGLSAGKVVGALICPEGAVIRDSSVNEFSRYEGESIRPGQIGFEVMQWSAFGYSTNALKTLKMALS
jgi:hypothetical protein